MKIFIFLMVLASCKSTITVEVTKMNGQKSIQKVKARKSICIADYDDSVSRLIDEDENVLIDSVSDYTILKFEK